MDAQEDDFIDSHEAALLCADIEEALDKAPCRDQGGNMELVAHYAGYQNVELGGPDDLEVHIFNSSPEDDNPQSAVRVV